jgi:Putative peptidoglycan binding domain
MSTEYYTDGQRSTSQQDNGNYGPRNQRPSGYRIWAIVIGAIVAAALVVLAVVGLTHNSSSNTPAPAATATVTAPAGPTTTANPAQPTTPATPPSAAVKQLQQELGQLNYYEGPVDGYMGPQTVAAIKDLQRQAGLPQTGSMNAATQKALQNYLKNGNNQMGGNS